MNLTKEQFFGEVASHELVILRDEGVYRHLRFTRPNTRVMQFDFITWPGYLCYTGDMGTFVFERIEDMLAFFRPSKQNKEDPFKWIDLRYWHEKLESLDKGGAKEFDPDAFRREITQQRRRILVKHGRDISAEQRQELWDDLGDLKDKAEDGEERAMAAAYDWSFDLNRAISHQRRISIGLDVDDFPDCKCWTHQFEWCCFALRWGVMAYDKAKQEQANAAAKILMEKPTLHEMLKNPIFNQVKQHPIFNEEIFTTNQGTNMNTIHTAEQAQFEAIAIITQSVNRLLDRAEKLGVTVTVTQSPLMPLAMGNTTATADVRPSHKSRSMSDVELIEAVNTVTRESASFAAQMLLKMNEKLTKVVPTEIDDAVLERMWNAYSGQAGGKTFDGKEFQFKTWSELGTERQACWRAAFLASREHLA